MILNREEFETECEIGLELYVDSCMLNQSNIVESMLPVSLLTRFVYCESTILHTSYNIIITCD